MKSSALKALLHTSSAVVIAVMLYSTAAFGAITVQLGADVASPGLVGSTIPLQASSQGGTLPLYKLEYRLDGEEWKVLRDFTRYTSFNWAPIREGLYQLRVTVIDFTAFEQLNPPSSSDTILFLILPRVISSPSVSPTGHPLVALFSAPPCAVGLIRVRFRRAGTTAWNHTDVRSCQPGQTNNIYVAGMRGNSAYWTQQEWIAGGKIVRGIPLLFTTGTPEFPFPEFQVTDSGGLLTDWNEPIIVSSVTSGPAEMVSTTARDLDGNVLWYYWSPPLYGQGAPNLLRPLKGGNMLLVLPSGIALQGSRWQILREIDVAGNVVRETSAFSISLQLSKMGHDVITAIHHEATRLPNGYTALLGAVERVVPSTDGDRNMLGDMIVVLDENFQVVWAWNGFEHLDVERRAVLGETCAGEQGGCPILVGFDSAEDWMHSNAIDYTPDGNLLISLRHQDWVVKINYDNGAGDGSILWRLGRGGDFTIVGADDWPEFSHQHDAEIEPNGLLTVFDNGNTRVASEGGNSRGLGMLLNERDRTAVVVVNADLGVYSPALGSAELLSNGNYSFSAGALNSSGEPGPFDTADLVETTPLGQQVYRNRQSEVGVYRHFRGSSLYDLD